jgi:ribosomal protein S18 acetylase RimI-like enzyme
VRAGHRRCLYRDFAPLKEATVGPGLRLASAVCIDYRPGVTALRIESYDSSHSAALTHCSAVSSIVLSLEVTMTERGTSFVERERRLLRAMRPRPDDLLEYDGWTVGLAANDAKRSRSVNALGPSTLPLEEKITWCEQRYAERGLPPVFRLTRFSTEGLDEALMARGYKVFQRSHIIVRPADASLPQAKPDLRFEWPALDEWLELTGSIAGRPQATLRAMAGRLAMSPLTSHPLVVLHGDHTVAYGLTRLDGELGWLEDIYVWPEARQGGVGTALCVALVERGIRHGTVETSLSVLADNTPAQGLYAKLGFEFVYDYWYRVRPEYAG